jgi:hypothetical protein
LRPDPGRGCTKLQEHLMDNFLAIFTGTPQTVEKSGWNKLSESARNERMQAGTKAWHAWMNANNQNVVVAGGPIGKTKRVSSTGVEDWTNAICGYVVVSAASHQAAAKMFEGHPHFAMLPGDGVEVMQCMPVPGA